MGYLISQIIFCLITAAVLGVALGWLLHGMLHHHDEVDTLRHQLKNALDDNHRLRAFQEPAEPALDTIPSANTAPSEPHTEDPIDEPEPNSTEEKTPTLTDSVSTDTETPAESSSPRTTQSNETPLDTIEGIGPGSIDKLRSIGINTTDDLLSKGRSPVGRANISEKTQIEAFVVKKWIAQADLLRIPGINGPLARLLQASHIDSPETLAGKEAFALLGAMKAVNNRERICPQLPSSNRVEQWIKAAQNLENAA